MKQKCNGKCREKNNLAISQKLGASNFKLKDKDQREIKHTHNASIKDKVKCLNISVNTLKPKYQTTNHQNY